jgi:hypothetical protein
VQDKAPNTLRSCVEQFGKGLSRIAGTMLALRERTFEVDHNVDAAAGLLEMIRGTVLRLQFSYADPGVPEPSSHQEAEVSGAACQEGATQTRRLSHVDHPLETTI